MDVFHSELESADVTWAKMKEAGEEVPKIARRCWPGYVKHLGRTLSTGDSDLDGAIAKLFTEDNAAFLQHQIQKEKLNGADPSFLFAIGAVAKHNVLNPDSAIYVSEATKIPITQSVLISST